MRTKEKSMSNSPSKGTSHLAYTGFSLDRSTPSLWRVSGLLASGEAGQERLKMISNTVPLGRLGTPDEIVKAVVFLASDDSSYITGTELFVDDGFARV